MAPSVFANLFQPSPGEALPDELRRPYTLLGNPNDPVTTGKIAEGADLLHAPFNLDPNHPDSYISRFGAPENFDQDPDQLNREEFLKWHTQAQLAYIYSHLTNKDGVLRIGTPPATVDVMISPAPGGDSTNPGNSAKMININALQQSTIGQLSSADLTRLVDNSLYPDSFNTFTQVVALGLQLETDPTALEEPGSPYEQLAALLLDLEGGVTGGTELADALITLSINGHDLDGAEDNADAARDILQEEIRALQDQVEAGAVFDLSAINTKAQEILDRVEDLNSFAKALIEGSALAQLPFPAADDGQPLIYPGAVSASPTDAQNRNLLASFRNLVNAERAHASALEASDRVTQGVATDELGRPLDAPGLMAAFVFNLSLKLQALNQFDTEVFNQLNALIKAYGVMQRLVNETLTAFNASETKEKRSLGGEKGTTSLASLGLTPEERAAVSMFIGDLSNIRIESSNGTVIWENGSFKNNPTSDLQDAVNGFVDSFDPGTGEALHPIEQTEGPEGGGRPDLDLGVLVIRIDADQINDFPEVWDVPEDGIDPAIHDITLGEFDRQSWATRLQQLNDAVTLLNQNSQLMFNEITTRSQQRTTFFEAASNALSKGQDVLQSITRNIA